MRSAVENVIYIYMTICVLLLLFNVLYIFRTKLASRGREDRIKKWARLLGIDGEKKEKDILLTSKTAEKLKKTDNLTAFQAAVSNNVSEEDAKKMFLNNIPVFRELALEYGKRNAMERAFFAYVIASFGSPAESAGTISGILLGYLEDSTVYCRENVLHALYALGSEQAVEHAFEIISERGWYHNPKLISDGMVKFNGDKAALAKRLWDRRDEFEESVIIGVVQFAAALKDSRLDDEFCRALGDEKLPTEVRFALVRYFGRHVYEPARKILLDILGRHGLDDGQEAISAAAALASYPGDETRKALISAVKSHNWYVRRNAAASLVRLGLTDAEEAEIRSSGDRYAVEMLDYIMEINGVSHTEKTGKNEEKGKAVTSS